MKIKYNGYTSFTFNVGGLVVLTDPMLAKSKGVKGIANEADIVVSSQEGEKFSGKPVNRDSVFEISASGEYEVAEFIVQRPIGANFYVFDYKLIRIVYLGVGSRDVDLKQLRDLGDVDVLILPYSDGSNFPSYEKIQEIISIIEPIVLVPYGPKDEGSKSKDEFIKYFGYINAVTEKLLKVESRHEVDDRSMKVVFLD